MANKTAITARLTELAPFFNIDELLFKAKDALKADPTIYDCPACGKNIGEPKSVDKPGVKTAVSYTVNPFGIWAHPACLSTYGIVVNSDEKAKKLAKKAASAQITAHFAEKQAGKATAALAVPTVSQQVADQEDRLTAEITSRLEAEYEDTFSKGIALIERLQAENAALKADVERYKGFVQNDSAPTPVKRGPGRPRKAA